MTSETPPSNHPRKRPRSDSDRSEVIPARTKDDELWFEDGNIVIVAQRVMFKVHMGVLSKHSEVFRDMFKIPQPPSGEQEQFDGCSLVDLSDGVDDVRAILSALYDGGNPKYIYVGHPLSFSVVAAMLRLGTKYQIDRSRQEAIRCLELSFPLTLSEMDAVGATELSTRTFPSISIEDEEFMDLVAVARECDLSSILPAALYGCLKLRHEQLVQGLVSNRWSSSDLITFYNNAPILRESDVVHFRRVLLQIRADNCSSASACRYVFRTIMDRYIVEKTNNPRASTFLLLPGSSLSVQANEHHMCTLCLKAFLDDYESSRTATWDRYRTNVLSNE